MSIWSVRAIERVGTPIVSWPSIWGPAPVVDNDPITSNALRTLDLSPHLAPLDSFSQMLERDLSSSSYESLSLDLVDPDQSLANALGPFGATLSTSSRYYGPWIEVTESWGTSSAVRWIGFIDETSIEWSEEQQSTRCTAIHASQFLRERKIKDIPSALRPWPHVPTINTEEYLQSSEGKLYYDLKIDLGITPPPVLDMATWNAAEFALWQVGEMTWLIGTKRHIRYSDSYGDPQGWFYVEGYNEDIVYDCPEQSAASLTFEGTSYMVDGTEWATEWTRHEDTSFWLTQPWGGNVYIYRYETITYCGVRILLRGAPDVSGILAISPPTQVAWDTVEETRTHYALAAGIPSPTGEGQRYMEFVSVEQLVPGDVLTITPSSGYKTSNSEARVLSVDGPLNRVNTIDPPNAATVADTYRIRRNSTDPVFVDGLTFAQLICAPFTFDTTYFTPPAVNVPVLSWLPYNVGSSYIFGAHLVQATSAGVYVIRTRGAILIEDGSSPRSGAYEGNWVSGFTWLGMVTTTTPLEVLGDIFQWPDTAVNTFRPPVLFISGDLSGGAGVPIGSGWNVWWRTLTDTTTYAVQWAPVDGSHSGTWPYIFWGWAAATIAHPEILNWFVAQTAYPGRYSRTEATGAITFEAHTGNEALGSPSAVTVTGTIPTGDWVVAGMAAYSPSGTGDDQEGFQAVIATGGPTWPFDDVTLALFSQESGTAVTVRQSHVASVSEVNSNWGIGGGLIVAVQGPLPWVASTLFRLNGTTVIQKYFVSLEIIAHTICAMTLQVLPQITGSATKRTVAGWSALAIETYDDDNFQKSRRIRFIKLDPNLNIINGRLEQDPEFPTDPAKRVLRGEIISDVVTDGSITCNMIRTGVGDELVGMIGGRPFQIKAEIFPIIERLKLEDMTVAEYTEQLGAAYIASAIPSPTGNIRFVSRSSGEFRTRLRSGVTCSVWPEERGPKTVLQAFQGYVSEVRVSYIDALTDDAKDIAAIPVFEGGKPMEIDVGTIISSESAARSVGAANASWFGVPMPVVTETWTDLSEGRGGELDPTFFADWQVGDLVTFDQYSVIDGATITLYKIHAMQPVVDDRTVNVELIRLPTQRVIAGIGA